MTRTELRDAAVRRWRVDTDRAITTLIAELKFVKCELVVSMAQLRAGVTFPQGGTVYDSHDLPGDTCRLFCLHREGFPPELNLIEDEAPEDEPPPPRFTTDFRSPDYRETVDQIDLTSRGLYGRWRHPETFDALATFGQIGPIGIRRDIQDKHLAGRLYIGG